MRTTLKTMSSFYITTPLYYVNDKPHLGHAYATITADVIARYHRLWGDDTRLLTGTDEHGQKIQEAATQRGVSPQQQCDEYSDRFRQAWADLNIQYDIFFRTTDEFHKKAVQDCLSQLYQSGDIYEDTYEGWYSVSEEIFYTEKDLVDGKSPSGREVTRIQEKNYFFRMSKYQQALIDHIENNPKFIQPEVRRNEVLGFLKQSLADLCISRPKARVNWGIELPFDKDYVAYVWFDALLNYATGVGYRQPAREQEFEKWWGDSGAVHLLGKDILITHAVYWTTMLLALGAPLPKHILSHGWILNKDMEKMSKSKGDVVNPLDMKDYVGVDGLRYYLMRDVHLGNDAPFSPDLVIHRVNNDLANNLGNLLSRTTNLVEKYFSGATPHPDQGSSLFDPLIRSAQETAVKVRTSIEEFQPSQALEAIVQLLNHANKLLEDQAPWKLAKEDPMKAAPSLYAGLEVLRIAGILLQPVMPQKMSELLQRLGVSDVTFAAATKWGLMAPGQKVEKGSPLFPRLEMPT